MKNPIPFIIALLCIQFMFQRASAQFGCTCLPEGITFTTQEEIDNFQANYPGCTEILGEVIISGNGIQNLNGLSCLVSFHGGLYIERTSLIKLTGLDNVQYIGGDFRIFLNEKLIGLNGLNALDSIIGSFSIITNSKLMTTTALENLAYVGGDLGVMFNDISDLAGFINLNYIGGKLAIRYEPLESLAGLENLTYIGGGMSIEGLSLTDLTGLNNVTVISGDLLIASTTLTSLTGLENLTAGFIEKLIISDNPLLSDCQIESICEYLAAPNGVLTIARNAPGCNSVVELSLACGGSMPCLPFGDYYFSTQADVDSFQSAFPGCTALEGSVLLTSGITNLNGLNSVTSIEGNLGIFGTGINNLVGLGSIISIGGDLEMGSNNNLYNLLGFDNLAIVNGSLILRSTHLQNLAGLESLSNVGGDILIQENFHLESLIGLDNLDSIGGSLQLYQNNSLTSLAGLQSLHFIEGNLELGKWPGCSGIGGNPLLTDLTGLNNLNTVSGDMRVMCNDSILSLEGLGNIASIGGSLSISGNNSLSSLAGLENLTYIGGSLSISNNDSLSVCNADWLCDLLANTGGSVNIQNNVPGCNSVIEVALSCGGLPCLTNSNYEFYSQADIDNFSQAFPGCNELEGNVYIDGDDITNLNGLNQVTSIGGGLRIGGYYSGNPVLTNLTGLENLTYIGGYLSIGDYNAGNPALTSLTGLDNLTYIGGSLYIRYNDSLSVCNADWLCDLLANTGGRVNIENNAPGCNSVIEVALSCGGLPCLPNGDYGFYSQADIDNFPQAFPGCHELEGNVGIVGDDITNLNGLNQVTSIGGGLYIGGYYSSNPVLTNLTGLENLTSIGGILSIYNNPTLTNLTGLDNIDAGSIYSLTIEYNNSLSDCAIESVCNYLASPNGDVWINGNAPGCNSLEEVEEACLVGVGQLDGWAVGQLMVIVYPNPFSEIVHIEFEIPNPGPVRIQIFNVVGNMVADLSDDILAKGQHRITWNVAYLPAGLYFVRLNAGKKSAGLKLIRQ